MWQNVARMGKCSNSTLTSRHWHNLTAFRLALRLELASSPIPLYLGGAWRSHNCDTWSSWASRGPEQDSSTGASHEDKVEGWTGSTLTPNTD